MAIKTKLLLFVLSVFLLSATFSLGTTEREDPELSQCKRTCEQQQQFSPQEQKICKEKCDEYHRQKESREGRQGGEWSIEADRRDPWEERQECQHECSRRPRHQQQACQKHCDEQYKERQQGGRGDDFFNTREREDPQREFQQCQDKCRIQHQGREEQIRCQDECRRRFEEQEKEQGRGGRGRESEWGEGEGFHHEGQQEGESGREVEENPFLFRHERFSSRFRSEHGNIRVLERFNRRSKLLKGLQNYRVSFTEANPNTFMVPSHWDADCICVVLSGRGAITLLHKDNKETHNLKQGDIFRTRAGTSLYKVNRDNNEKLYIFALEIPVNTPGQFEGFFPTGGRDQDSFFNAFSDEILQAAFNSPADQLKKMFQGQKSVFVQASQEQIKALTGDSSEHGVWPFHKGGESRSRRPYNIFENGPAESNKFGKLHEAKPSDYEELQDNDVAVAFANITRGGMLGPYYNSRSTKIAMVVNGNGFFEIACPHLSQQGQGQQGQEGSTRGGQRGSSYQKVRARVSRGDVYIIPAGHPVVTVASTDQNLEVVCFEINAENNERYPLAGNNNILKQMERQAKELSFNIPVKQVEEMLNKQKESWFFPGPRQERQHGGGYASA